MLSSQLFELMISLVLHEMKLARRAQCPMGIVLFTLNNFNIIKISEKKRRFEIIPASFSSQTVTVQVDRS